MVKGLLIEMKYLIVSNCNLLGYIYWLIYVGVSNKVEFIILNE